MGLLGLGGDWTRKKTNGNGVLVDLYAQRRIVNQPRGRKGGREGRFLFWDSGLNPFSPSPY